MHRDYGHFFHRTYQHTFVYTLSGGGGKARRMKISHDMPPRYFNKIYYIHNNTQFGERKLVFITSNTSDKTKYSTKKPNGDCPREFIIEKYLPPTTPYAQGNSMQYTIYNGSIEYEFTQFRGKFKLECDIAWRIGPELKWQRLNASKDKF